MKTALVAGVLAVMVCAGCVTTSGTFLTDVKITSEPGPGPSRYTVDFRITEVEEDGSTSILSCPRVTVLAGEEAKISLGEGSEEEEISCKALVKENDGSTEVVTSVTVKGKGKPRWSLTQSMSVLAQEVTQQ